MTHTQRRSPVSRELAAWLAEQCRALPVAARLPNTLTLAHRWSLSPRTVGTLVRQAAASGLLHRVNGRGTFTGQRPPPAVPAARETRSAADQLSERILAMIRDGSLSRGDPLPSSKFLCRTYHLSPSTVSSAYRSLIARGYAVRIGRSVRFGEFDQRPRAARRRDVYLVVPDGERAGDVFGSSPYAPAYRVLENHLATHGLVLRTTHLRELPTLAGRWVRAAESAPRGIIMVRASNAAVERVLDHLDTLVRSRARPVVLLDWDDSPPRHSLTGATLLSRPNVETALARRLATFLFDQSARSVTVCIGADQLHHSPSLWTCAAVLRFRAELKHLDPRCELRVCVVGEAPGPLPARFSQLHDRAAVARALSKYTPTPPETIDAESRFCADLQTALEWSGASQAWIIQQDSHAAAALGWAAQHRVRVPERTGIVSLEGNPEYYHLGFTRCQPDWMHMGHAMAHLIIGDIPLERSTKGFLRTRALMVEKLTTRVG